MKKARQKLLWGKFILLFRGEKRGEGKEIRCRKKKSDTKTKSNINKEERGKEWGKSYKDIEQSLQLCYKMRKGLAKKKSISYNVFSKGREAQKKQTVC